MFLISTPRFFVFFLFYVPSPTAIYTLSLHDALPIWRQASRGRHWFSARGSSHRTGSRSGHAVAAAARERRQPQDRSTEADRKSTRLNSSHTVISYAVFCLKKKKTK